MSENAKESTGYIKNLIDAASNSFKDIAADTKNKLKELDSQNEDIESVKVGDESRAQAIVESNTSYSAPAPLVANVNEKNSNSDFVYYLVGAVALVGLTLYATR